MAHGLEAITLDQDLAGRDLDNAIIGAITTIHGEDIIGIALTGIIVIIIGKNNAGPKMGAPHSP